MANYTVRFRFNSGHCLATTPTNKPDDPKEFIKELCSSKWQSFTSLDGTVDVVNLQNVNCIQIEKLEE